MSHDIDVVVVGEVNADLLLQGNVTPVYGQVEQTLDDMLLTIGASSCIFACGAARLGLRVALIGKVGDDELGQFMLRALHDRGVDTSGVVVDPTLKTGLTVILSRQGDRALLTYPGSMAALTYDDIDMKLVSRARHMHVGSYYMLNALRSDVPRLFQSAHAHGLTVSLDTNYDPRETWADGIHETLRHTDVFLPNQTELLAIARVPDVGQALAALAHVPAVAVKLGAQGACARSRTTGTIPACVGTVPMEVIDTTGAGDSFDAGFVYGYLAGWDTLRTLRFASVCGSLSTRGVGGTPTQATLPEAQQLEGICPIREWADLSRQMLSDDSR